jgi:hypothetical protein
MVESWGQVVSGLLASAGGGSGQTWAGSSVERDLVGWWGIGSDLGRIERGARSGGLVGKSKSPAQWPGFEVSRVTSRGPSGNDKDDDGRNDQKDHSSASP